MDKKDVIGKVIHYYDKIGVAVVKLNKGIKAGDKVKFMHGEDGFEQEVSSMQLEHAPISQAKKGDEVAIKVDKVVKDNWQVFAA